MDAARLRELQAPLKQAYRDDPARARTPMRASAGFDDPGITATVDTWSGPVRAGLHPVTGGDGSDAMQDIRVVAELDTDADDATLERLGALTERYCVVAQTLAERPTFTVRRSGAD